jgi:hypothetical protein
MLVRGRGSDVTRGPVPARGLERSRIPACRLPAPGGAALRAHDVNVLETWRYGYRDPSSGHRRPRRWPPRRGPRATLDSWHHSDVGRSSACFSAASTAARSDGSSESDPASERSTCAVCLPAASQRSSASSRARSAVGSRGSLPAFATAELSVHAGRAQPDSGGDVSHRAAGAMRGDYGPCPLQLRHFQAERGALPPRLHALPLLHRSRCRSTAATAGRYAPCSGNCTYKRYFRAAAAGTPGSVRRFVDSQARRGGARVVGSDRGR